MEVKIGLLGLGTVGSGVVRIIEGHQADLQSQVGCPIKIEKILDRNIHKGKALNIQQGILTTDPWEVLHHPEIQVIVETMGGIETAREYILEALSQGKHVVTANKDLMATHGREILQKAAECGCDIYYEASVAGGVPILRPLEESFTSDQITRIMGIINGTTNYILTKMSQEGATYEAALQEAQQLGYAEADPTSDVEGIDAAYKIAILGNLGFHVDVDIDDVEIKGISQVTKKDVLYGQQLGYEIKLLGIADYQDGLIGLSVQPTMVKKSHPLAAINGAFNAVYVYGKAVGETMFYGPGAGQMPTATSVVADIVAISKNMKLGVNGLRTVGTFKEKRLKTAEQMEAKYFVLLAVKDQIGVMAQIAQSFAACEISLDAVLQKSTEEAEYTEIIIITHTANKANMDRALSCFENMEVIQNVASVYQVVE